MDLQKFVTRLVGIPHLASRIIGFLDTKDIPNLLTAGRVCCQLFSLAAGHHGVLRDRVNDEATMATLTKGHWTKLELGNSDKRRFDPNNFEEFFLLNNHLFAISDSTDKAPAKLMVFSLQGKCVMGGTCIANGKRIVVQISNWPTLFVDNGDTVEAIGQNLNTRNRVKNVEIVSTSKKARLRLQLSNEDTYILVKKESDDYQWELKFLLEEEVELMVTKWSIPLITKPAGILNKVVDMIQYVLFIYCLL